MNWVFNSGESSCLSPKSKDNRRPFAFEFNPIEDKRFFAFCKLKKILVSKEDDGFTANIFNESKYTLCEIFC